MSDEGLTEMVLPVDYQSLEWQERRAVRNEYVKRQDGKCMYCHESLSGEPSASVAAMKVTPRLYPESFFNHPVHLHHDHNTGMTIGAVHCHCNAVLWEHEGE